MIFLSYRQKDTAHLVGRLRDRLIALYGEDEVVFRDKMSLKAGDDWGTRLMAEVTRLPVFLAVVGPGWAEAKYTKDDNKPDRVGELRLDDPDDWVRKEIRTGLDVLGKLVVVVRATGTGLPPKPWLERRGIAELHDKQGILLRDDPDFDGDVAALTKVLEAKHSPLKALCAEVRRPVHPLEPSKQQPAKLSLLGKPSLPGKPPVCVGREDLLKNLEEKFLPTDPNAPLPRFAIAGVGGMGKSTAILWFLHDDRVKQRYGENRHFVPLDGTNSRAGVVTKLAENLSVEAGPNLEGRVLAALEKGGRRLLVLDNAETPLQSKEDRLAVEDLLGTLAHFAHVGLLATLRPKIHLPRWDAPAEVERLNPPDDLGAFCEHAGNKFQLNDTDAVEFVTGLEGWPLVLRLAAEQAKHYRTVGDFRSVWERKRAELLQQGNDKGSNFAVSVGLSLDALRQRNVNAVRLLAVLIRIPAGLLHDDVPDVLGDEGVEAAAAVREVGGLIVEGKERMRMLAPLREHLEPLLPFEGADRERVITFYCDMATAGEKVGKADAQAVITRLASRATACVAMITNGLTADKRQRVYTAARGLGNYGRFVGLNFSEPLRDAVAVAAARGDSLEEADCTSRLGEIALYRSDRAEAGERYDRALMLYRGLGDVHGEANCVQGLGDISLYQADYAEAGRRYDQALPLYRQVGSVIGEANCILSLGELALRRLDYAEAKRQYNEALPLFRQSGSVLGEANCIHGLGNVAHRRSDHDEARRRYEEALPLYRRVGSVLGEANGIRSLGDIARTVSDLAIARRRYHEALALYLRIEEPYSTGGVYRHLARITTDSAERTMFVAAARKAWLSIDRLDLVAKLDKEFPPEAPSTPS